MAPPRSSLSGIGYATDAYEAVVPTRPAPSLDLVARSGMVGTSMNSGKSTAAVACCGALTTTDIPVFDSAEPDLKSLAHLLP